MRIENNSGVNGVQGVRRKSACGIEDPGGRASDAVELSSRAADMRAAMDALQSAPPIRQERVLELRQQLDQGTFDTSADALAEKLLKGNVDG